MVMLSPRPFLYLSLPGVAFILGVIWFRHKNKKNDNTSCFKDEHSELAQNIGSDKYVNTKADTVNIDINKNSDEIGITKLFGRSAPIEIIQNGRSLQANQPIPSKVQDLDTDILKTKIQDADQKRLKSIDEDFENMSSPIDLPDSFDNRPSYKICNVSCKLDAPVVVKATKTPKISPENSFFESKYTPCIEENNNVEKLLFCSMGDTDLIHKQKHIDTNASLSAHGLGNASPTLSLCSDKSGDSGNGSSLPRSEGSQGKIIYEFFFPYSLIGLLYGKKQSFVKKIKESTSAVVSLSKSKYVDNVKICKVVGSEKSVNSALHMIRKRLPIKKYPNFTMQRILHALPQTIVPLSDENLQYLQLNLIEGINNDVIVTSVITGGHLFVQHPLHPSHPSLDLLQKYMHESYSKINAPLLPCAEINAVCVLGVNNFWYRVQILDNDNNNQGRCLVKFLDFGGYLYTNFKELRQIRSDFMAYPFQATECVLSNIEPIGTEWHYNAADILCKLTKGIVLQAQVAGYNKYNIPEIYLFACLGPNNVIFINKELVARNLARWVEIAE